MKKTLLLLFLFISISCKTDVKTGQDESQAKNRGVIAENAMVVSARKEASEIGAAIMEKGGNAFDAMVATEMALAVTFPFAGNLGGGGFMVYRLSDGQTGALDYREKAPMAAHRDMYLDEEGKVISERSRRGGLAVGVPGTVAGIFAVHEKFGSLPIQEILDPVIQLSRRGYVVTENDAQSLKGHQDIFIKTNQDTILFAIGYAVGDTIKNSALANSLELLMKEGKDSFYQGAIGEELVAYVQKHGGIITMADLAAYEAVWRKPVSFKYQDLNIISMSPPSSGGIVMGQIFGMIEPYSLKEYGHNSIEYIQVLTEAERRAYADRSFYLGDPDFVDIPVETLLSDTYLKNRMDSFSFEKATSSSELAHGTIPGYESMETTHYSIVDSSGNAIAVTTTLNGAYGSKLYVEDLGFFLNNEMDDFSSKPGDQNMFGLIGGEANAIEPEKRMLSSMTPTLVEKEGKFWMSIGTPGGSTIITSVLQSILNVSEFGMSMQEAVDAPRFHHQWIPEPILFESVGFSTSLLDSLAKKGYEIQVGESTIIGKVDGILRLPNGRLEGGADRRGDDTAIGF